MSMYDVERVEKPKFWGIRPTTRGRGKRVPYIIGFDSEGDDSRPFLFQFSEPGGSEDDVALYRIPPTDNAGLHTFMQFICRRLLGRFGRNHEIVIYGWNLSYEWTQLFHDLTDVADQDEVNINLTATYQGHDYTFIWTVYNDKRVFAKITQGSGLTIRVLDGMMFYKTGLDKAAKMLGLGEKYRPNDGCDQPGAWHENDHDPAYISRALLNDPELLTYARRDAYITRLVGEQIVSLHEAYDIPQTISAPHFASSVFKRQFLAQEIALPETQLEQAGLWSYHGGKNGFYLPGPQRVEGCWQYDITSAYPEAMRQLPNIEESDWQKVVGYKPGRHAIYIATLSYRRCPWRGMMMHDGRWPESGYIEDVCLTSYELDVMVQRGEATILSCSGWEMVGLPGGPLVQYVDTFFAQKARSEGAERETAKLMLNSLYGKFFQKVEVGTVGYYDLSTRTIIERNPDGPFDWKAGGLYHPPIASLITGFVRAKIHHMEHDYQSIMTSTDGMFALEPPRPGDIGTQLGDLTAQYGDLDIWRERLYVFRSNDLPKPKAAFHGFWGSLAQLEAVPLASGLYEYQSRHMVTLKESLKAFGGRYYEPGSFITVDRSINL